MSRVRCWHCGKIGNCYSMATYGDICEECLDKLITKARDKMKEVQRREGAVKL